MKELLVNKCGMTEALAHQKAMEYFKDFDFRLDILKAQFSYLDLSENLIQTVRSNIPADILGELPDEILSAMITKPEIDGLEGLMQKRIEQIANFKVEDIQTISKNSDARTLFFEWLENTNIGEDANKLNSLLARLSS